MKRIAPNVASRMWLMRPVLAEPPLCSIVDLRTTWTLCDVADAHELLDLREALAEKAREADRPRR